MFNDNFFAKLEEENKEQESMRVQLELINEAQMQTKKKYEALKRSQSPVEYHEFVKRKNILETKLFKKKYEKVARHISGIPKQDKHNPFNQSHKPSVFNETLADPKMGIPQNEELFNHVIKYANKEAENKQDQKKGTKIGKNNVEA